VHLTSLRGLAALALAGGLLATACSTGTSTSTATTAAVPSPASVSATSFDSTFAAMSGLRPLVGEGHGTVVVLLPDTASSPRYAEFDAPDLTRAFTTAGLPATDFAVVNAGGSGAAQLAQAQTAVAGGATVLVLDAVDPVTGVAIEQLAASHHVAVIDYDRLTAGGTRDWYVGFDDVAEGAQVARGLSDCLSAWHVAKPQVAVVLGSTPADQAAGTAQGVTSVVTPLVRSGAWVLAAQPPATSDPATAEAEFQQAVVGHPATNAVLTTSDATADPIIAYLKTTRTPPRRYPVTGVGATLVGLQNVVAGYQCGTVEEPIDREAQAAAALALFVRAGARPPAALVGVRVEDPTTRAEVPAVVLGTEWVTSSTLATTVLRDGTVTRAELCAGAYAADCRAAGLG